MATFSSSIAPTNASDAEFRAWINFIHNGITTTGGWVQTADTGQINFATVTTPGAANTKQGFAMYRMDDALQATKPIFLKIGFGSGPSQQAPGLWFAIGSATDGAGTFIDPNDDDRAAHYFDKYSQSAAAISRNNFQSTTRESFGSVGTDRFVMYLFEAVPEIEATGDCMTFQEVTADHNTSEANYSTLFSIERGRDWDGATNGDYIIVMWSDTSARVSQHIVIDLDHSLPVLANLSGMVYALTGVYFGIWIGRGDDIPATAPIPFRRNTYPIPPGVNLATSGGSQFEFEVNYADPCEVGHSGLYITGTTIGLNPYGVARTYRTCAGIRMANFPNSGQDAGAFVYVLYE